MSSFGASSQPAKLKVKLSCLSHGVSYVERRRIIPSKHQHFHTKANFELKAQAATYSPVPSPSKLADANSVDESVRLLSLVRAYQIYGHLKAKLDPLGLQERQIPDDLKPEVYGFSEAKDHDRNILARLEEAYCGSIGYEFMHIVDSNQRNWLREKIETLTPIVYSQERRKVMLDRLCWSTQFETVMAAKWTAGKRYGADGCEALIPGIKEMFDKLADLGAESIVIGASHRGRRNVSGNVVGKAFSQIFSEFINGTMPTDEAGVYTGTGDFEMSVGYSNDVFTRSGKRIHLSLVATPSHLEAVDPVAVGKTRAKQYYSDDTDRTKNMAVLIHGDGSFAGQGVVYETLQLSALPKYSTGGTIHIVIDNQVSVTADPRNGRSSHYCTDVAKAFNVPIFHVNGDDLEAVVHVCELAAEWRQTFHSDVVVHIVCYRRFGHPETDDPFFTQPKMYKVIRSHPSAWEIYKKKLLESGQVTQEEVDEIQKRVNRILNEEFEAGKDYKHQRRDWLSGNWAGFKSPEQLSPIRNTGVKLEMLKNIGKAITTIPENFKPHSAVKKVFEQRAEMIETGEGVDWAFAEALAFATLLVEGKHVRLGGLDVERGTFSHRHYVLHDQETGHLYCPLDHVKMNQSEEMFTVSNSSLCEYGVLGFETGYSMENPNSLVIWEAQFGDFSNVAQVIFDQFLSCGEAKWLRQSGLVVLLPHGYDGKGPDHSNARIERFLQMSDDNPNVIPEMDHALRKQIQECNWQVVNVTTPANYFHVLRRQMHREFRKPLIVMAPKNLLNHKECKSNLSEFDGYQGFDKQGTRFKRLISDQNDHSHQIRRLVLCTGKIYYELEEHRRKVNGNDVAICRIEQLCPFPYDLVQYELKRYPNAEIVWCQEEPMNIGAYDYIAPRLSTAMKDLGRGTIDDIKYVGRSTSPATATGFFQVHVQEQAEIIEKALQPEPIPFP